MNYPTKKYSCYLIGAIKIGVMLYLFVPTYYFGDSTITTAKSMMNLPQWYRTRDWGLRKTKSLENLRPHNDYPGNDEEEIIAWNNFFYGTTNGIILELGAMDGRNWSVSQFFEVEAGWKSILLEGNPIQAAVLQRNRPNAINFNAVICEKPRNVHFVQNRGTGGILEFMAQGFLTRFHSNLMTNGKLDDRKLAKDKSVNQVPCVPLSHFLYPLKIYHINYFVLDVEGGELNVLKAIDFEKIKFDVVSVETDRGTDSQVDTKNYVDAVIELLTSKGYVLWSRKKGRNSWFRHSNFTGYSKTHVPHSQLL